MKILIIEDESAIAEVEKAYIEREGYGAEIARDGLEGLAKFRSDTFDLVLLDLMLPGMAGADVCRE
ncbi:MAG: response regulator, partial [Cloacibacillus evryensis]